MQIKFAWQWKQNPKKLAWQPMLNTKKLFMNYSRDAPPAYLSFCPRDTLIFCLLVTKDICSGSTLSFQLTFWFFPVLRLLSDASQTPLELWGFHLLTTTSSSLTAAIWFTPSSRHNDLNLSPRPRLTPPPTPVPPKFPRTLYSHVNLLRHRRPSPHFPASPDIF